MILSPTRRKMDDAAATPQNSGSQQQRSLFGSLKRNRSQRSNASLSGSHKSLSGFLNDARTVAAVTCNAVFSEFGHSPTNGARKGASSLSPFGAAAAATSSLAFFSAGEPSVPSAGPPTAGSTGPPHEKDQQDAAMASQQQQHPCTKEVVRQQLHRASDGIFLSTDASSRRGSLTAPPPRKGRRRMGDEDDENEKIVWNGSKEQQQQQQQQFMPKVMSSPALTQFDAGTQLPVVASGHSHLSIPPLSDGATAAAAAAAMSLSDGEDAVMDFLQKHSVPTPAPSTAPMNSPPSNSNVKRVYSMPALAAHTHDANIEEEAQAGATTTTDVSVPPDTNPDEYLRTIMGGMGYPTEPVDTLSVTNFFHEHTPEQIAAYDNETCGAARSDDLDGLRALHRGGKTLQCSNRFGESLIHIACRRGSLPVIAFLLDEAGVSIRVRDDCGRTPLHVS